MGRRAETGRVGGDDSADTADSGDTGETADSGEDCVAVQGGGCGALAGETRLVCGDDTGGGGDSAPARVQGSGCGAIGGGPALALLLVVALRRGPWTALLLLALAWPARAGVDGQAVDVLDGGPYVALREASAGAPWSFAGGLSFNYVRAPVVLVDADGSLVMLSSARTRTVAASVRLGELTRVGVALPSHRQSVFLGDIDKKTMGDISAWLMVPILDAPARGPSVAWTVQLDVPTGADERYLGDANGGVHGLVSVQGALGRIEGLANAGVRLAAPVALPGITWGNRWTWGAGLGLPIWGPVGLQAELFGSLGVRPDWGNPADFPVEALTTARVALPRGFAASLGGGAGLSHGLGSPSLRLIASIDVRPGAAADRDGDGLSDPRDRCPDEPEDLDEWRDNDGCPEPDNDADGLLDPSDACPDEPETVNAVRDEDGCPDVATTLRVTVTSSAPERLERATLRLDESPALAALPGEPVAVVLPDGPHSLRVEAEGHAPRELPLFLSGEPLVEREVRLEPVVLGELVLSLRDPGGTPLSGVARVGERELAVPAEGARLAWAAGPVTVSARAAGYRPGAGSAEIPPGAAASLTITLQPSPTRLAGRSLETEQRVSFELDQAVLGPEDEAALLELAGFLRDNPGIHLIRVEGHADESADSAYNLDLSRRRANAVRDRLIALGVAPERLEAIGTGEARLGADAVASRRVTFLVLVWEDDLYTPALDAR